MTRRYHALQDLFLNYFHPDWRLESGSRADAVRKYLATAHPNAVQQLISEIHELLGAELTDEQLRELLLKQYSLFYDPWKDEVTAREWLAGVAQDLEAANAA